MVRRLLAICLALGFAGPAAADTLKILTFNIWGAGLHRGHAIEDTVAILRAADADIVGLQEAVPHRAGAGCASEACVEATGSLACAIAARLAYHCFEQPRGEGLHGVNAVLSRHPVAGMTPEGLGVRIAWPGRDLTVFNMHLPDAPYQPYQLAGIPYDDALFLTTAAEAEAAA
ncbi:MAG: endonuclease/exonuclease/phosphatase family protein, partial [Beijerinckiaceae bacterium]